MPKCRAATKARPKPTVSQMLSWRQAKCILLHPCSQPDSCTWLHLVCLPLAGQVELSRELNNKAREFAELAREARQRANKAAYDSSNVGVLNRHKVSGQWLWEACTLPQEWLAKAITQGQHGGCAVTALPSAPRACCTAGMLASRACCSYA